MKKIALFGLSAGIGFFGACLAFGHWGMKKLDRMDLTLSDEIEDDGFITVIPRLK